MKPVIEQRRELRDSSSGRGREYITSQLLGCINEYKIDPVVDKENGDQADDIVTKKEKMLYE